MPLKNQFTTVKALTEKYDLPTKELNAHIEEMEDFKVTTPIIGGFSTGKSTMINAFLGERLLRTKITAETAIPAEISYGPISVVAVKGDVTESLTVADLTERTFSIHDTDYVQIQLENEMLASLPTTKLVDMPGFDSGIQSHNTAIDQYLPKSLAYILTISAEEPVVKESIADFLNELKLYDVPVYVCVTKADKVTATTLENNIKAINESVERFLGISPKKIVPIWSKKNRNVNGLIDILSDIEASSRHIFEKRFSTLLQQHVKNVEQYLVQMLKGTELSVSELDEQEANLLKDIAHIQETVTLEQKRFTSQLQSAISNIQGKIDQALQNNASVLVDMLVRGQDIQAKLNLIVRSAITEGIKTEFEPKLQKHVDRLSYAIQLDLPAADTSLQNDILKEKTTEAVKNLAIKSLPAILALIGITLTGPIGGIILAALPIIADLFFSKKKEQEARAQAEQKVSGEIIPQVSNGAGQQVAQELENYTAEVHAMIQQEVEKQRDLLQKALQDIRHQKLNEQATQEQVKAELAQDLAQLRGILNDIVVHA